MAKIEIKIEINGNEHLYWKEGQDIGYSEIVETLEHVAKSYCEKFQVKIPERIFPPFEPPFSAVTMHNNLVEVVNKNPRFLDKVLDGLALAGMRIERKTDWHYRIEDYLDVYPTKKKIVLFKVTPNKTLQYQDLKEALKIIRSSLLERSDI